MNSPELPDGLDPTIDHSLFELNGTTYKNRSRSAAAKRAAYHRAMSSKHKAMSSKNRTKSLASSNNAPFSVYDIFSNYGTAPDYTAEYGTQGPGEEGWIMHSLGSNDSCRLLFNLSFNDGSTPYTLIEASMRGAPDNGKNSYVCLREWSCAEEGAQYCDEIDIVEYYGQLGAHRSEWTFYQNGNTTGNVGHGTYPTQTDPGADVYAYSLYLENGSYISFAISTAQGAQPFYSWEGDSSQGYVPTQTMYLYAGIWDCSSREGAQDWCTATPPGPFTGDSWMALQALAMESRMPGTPE
jgi:hypothetical protein